MKICPVGAYSMQTDKTKPIVPSCNVANATKTYQVYERGHDH